jgi:hypothetical protein
VERLVALFDIFKDGSICLMLKACLQFFRCPVVPLVGIIWFLRMS